MSRTFFFRAALWLLAGFAAFAQVSPKLDPSLNGASGPVPVVVLLRQQPHADLARQTLANFAAQLNQAANQVQNQPGSDAAVGRWEQVVAAYRTALRTLIEVQTGSTQLAAQARIGLLGGTNFRRYNIANMISMRLPATALPTLANDAEVAYIFRDRPIPLNLDVSTASFGAPTFWNPPLNITGAGIKVGVIDTGVIASHPGFAGAVTDQNVFHAGALAAPPAESLYADDGTVNDNHGHGTHVAGIVASRGTAGFPNHLGVARGASVVNLKAGYRTTTGGGSMYFSDLVAAMDWGYFTANVSIFNLSFGGPSPDEDPIEHQILDDLIRTYGIFFAAAAGNGGRVQSPGFAYNTTQVGAMDDKGTVGLADDTVAAFSSTGPTTGGRTKPDLAAPGVGITSFNTSGGFVASSGTSMASPHVAGAAALLRQAGVSDPRLIKAKLIHSAPTGGWINNRGFGYANLATAAAQLGAGSMETIPPATTRLFRFTHTTGLFKATMVWDRFFTGAVGNRVPQFNNLDLALYNRANGVLTGTTPSTVSNVEQVSTSAAGSFVIRVSSPATLSGGIAAEEYAWVVTPAVTLTPATGPALSINCPPPSGARMNVTTTLSCTATNNGDLEAYNVFAGLAQPGGWAAVSPLNFGTLAPGGSRTLSWTITPRTQGAVNLIATLTASAFGTNYSIPHNIPFTVLPPLYNITGRVTLNSSSGPGMEGVTVTLSGGASGSFVTDANGNYAFNGLAAGLVYTVTPAKPGSRFTPVNYTSPALAANLTVNFTGVSIISISGRVTDAATGLGAPNVTVRTMGTLALSATTNATGHYTIPNLNQGGNYSVIPTPLANMRLDVAKRVYLAAATMADITTADFTLSSTSTLTNNEATAPDVIAALPAFRILQVAAATVNAADPIPSCGFERGNDSVWYQYTPDFNGVVDVSTFGSNYDTLIAAYQTAAVPSPGNEVGCNDDFAGSQTSKLLLPVTAGQTYKFLVSGFNAGTVGSILHLNINRAN